MSVRLISLDGHADIPLDRIILVVGRHRRCDVLIASPHVSRRHCSLALDRDGVVIRDLGSTNGTRINGERIEQGVMHPGDELSIAFCRYHLEGLAPSCMSAEFESRKEVPTAPGCAGWSRSGIKEDGHEGRDAG